MSLTQAEAQSVTVASAANKVTGSKPTPLSPKPNSPSCADPQRTDKPSARK